LHLAWLLSIETVPFVTAAMLIDWHDVSQACILVLCLVCFDVVCEPAVTQVRQPLCLVSQHQPATTHIGLFFDVSCDHNFASQLGFVYWTLAVF